MSVRSTQEALNHFTSKHLRGIAPLRVDGKPGPATDKRIRQCKWWLGYARSKRDDEVTLEFRERLWHSRNPRYVRHGTRREKARAVARGVYRRLKHNRAWRKHHRIATRTHGVVLYDGVPCAAWMVPYFDWARHVGHNGVKWMGRLVSGFRTKAYSQHLCYEMCDAPRCPGRCAGIYTNHVGQDKPKGAGDVTDYVTFGELMPHCPYEPHLWNNLPADRVHFSATGN